MRDSTLITRVVLENFKSIASCDVRLGPLNFLVGPNGAGKSNFLSALRLVADSLNTSLVSAMRGGGSFRNAHPPTAGSSDFGFGIRLDFLLDGELPGSYAFRMRMNEFEIEREELRIGYASEAVYFVVASGKVESTSTRVSPAVSADRLYLVNALGLPEFRPAFEALSNMAFYNFDVGRSPDFQSSSSERLARDGGNVTSILALLEDRDPPIKKRIEEYLRIIVPGFDGLDVERKGGGEFLFFNQSYGDPGKTAPFFAMEMSEGTRHALGVLVALLQTSSTILTRTPLLGIEEPETMLHPAAAGVILDCLREASEHTQIIVTSHSPDLLDDKDIDTDSILAVEFENGSTRIAPLDAASRSVLRERLYSPGELLRLNQLAPDFQHVRAVDEHGPLLFDAPLNP